MRIFLVKFMAHSLFDNLILLAIILNSILLALTDYTQIRLDVAVSDELYADLDTRQEVSMRNYIQEKMDPLFSYIFLAECTIKILAMGFILHKNSYLRDSWNVLDFIIVITSIISMTGIKLNVSAIRTMRVMRPLKTLTALPGLQVIVKSLLASIPALSSVLVLIVFVFMIFGILGTQVFVGLTHQRCRVTPFPVTLDYVHELHQSEMANYRCLNTEMGPDSTNFTTSSPTDPSPYNVNSPSFLDAGNYDTPNDAAAITTSKEASPWYNARPCYWPVAPTDYKVCTYSTGAGAHQCVNPTNTPYDKLVGDHYNITSDLFTWCGSNFDAWGNMRFGGDVNVTFDGDVVVGVQLPAEARGEGVTKFMDQRTFTMLAEYHGGVNFGFTNFDDFLHAFVTTFQAITQEGWTDIMYFCVDGNGFVLAEVFFGVLIVFGSFFVVNLLLAVLEENYASGKEDQKHEHGE